MRGLKFVFLYADAKITKTKSKTKQLPEKLVLQNEKTHKEKQLPEHRLTTAPLYLP